MVWIPLVINANRTMPKGAGGNLDHLLGELPAWARVATAGFIALARLVRKRRSAS